MKIAFFNYLMLEYGGGTATFFIKSALELSKRFLDINPSIVTFDQNFCEKIRTLYSIYFFKKKYKIDFKERSKEIKKILNNIEYVNVNNIENLKKMLNKYDLIYSKNDFFEIFLLGYVIGFNNLPPVIIGFHTPPFYERADSMHAKFHNMLYRSLIYKHALKKARFLHVINSFDEIYLKKFVSSSKVIKIYNPFDFLKYRKSILKNDKLNIKFERNKFHILWVGRLTEQKGISELLKIIANCNNSKMRKKIRWHIVGEGELKNKIIQFLKTHSNVKFYSHVPLHAMPLVYSKADILINTSRWESFPYTILEAQSFGIPVICYNIHGCNEIIESNKNGFLIENTDEFISTLKRAINHYHFSKQKVKLFIEKKFNVDDLYLKYYEMLKAAI